MPVLCTEEMVKNPLWQIFYTIDLMQQILRLFLRNTGSKVLAGCLGMKLIKARKNGV
jgi:hypothetical protein